MPEVRLVGDNVETGIYSYEEAMRIAESQGLDLVEITAKADPPVCRVIDYQKFSINKNGEGKKSQCCQNCGEGNCFDRKPMIMILILNSIMPKNS